MNKKLKFTLWILLAVFVLLFTAGECLLRFKGFKPALKENSLTSRPHHFLMGDSVLGWKLRPGGYSITYRSSANIFKAMVDESGNRISCNSCVTRKTDSRPCLQVYGCSYTFGVSVPDTATECYKLQQLLPQARVENKGVPGYGLMQMYLSLKQSVGRGDTPAVAVFNYANFHDWRTPLNKAWSAGMVYPITGGGASEMQTMSYPYAEYIHDSLIFKSQAFKNLYHNWPLRYNLAIINRANGIADYFSDKKTESYLHLISLKTALQIMQYCKSNHIIPVFALLTPGFNDIPDSVAEAGYITLDYGIVVWDNFKPNPYNCAPLDPEHPNGRAHSIYAQKLFALLKDKDLLNQPVVAGGK